MTPVDLQDLRTRRGPRPAACLECGELYPSKNTLVCRGCFAVHIEDPSALALCDEIEALRAANLCPACAGAGAVEMHEEQPRWICFMCNGSGRLTDHQAVEIRVRTQERDEARAQLAAVLQLPGVVDKVEFRLSDLNDTLASLAAARASGPQVDELMAEHRRLEGALKATGQPGWR